MVNDTCEVPFPVDGPVSAIHGVFDTATHEHDDEAAVIATALAPPGEPTGSESGDTVNEHDVAAVF